MERTPEETARRKRHGIILLLFIVGVVLETAWVMYSR